MLKNAFTKIFAVFHHILQKTPNINISHLINHVIILGGKQWQATPKNLPRMQRTRAIPVA